MPILSSNRGGVVPRPRRGFRSIPPSRFKLSPARLGSFVAVLLTTLTLAACDRTGPPPVATTEPHVPAAVPDFRFVSGEDHNFLDPQKMSWLHDIRVAECMFEPLVRFKLPELTLEPAAAERWEISDDKLTYTFHLRAESKWSNGDPVTAQDFIYAWRRALLPDLAADYSQLFFRIAGAEAFFGRRLARLKAYAAGSHAAGDAAAKALWDDARKDFESAVGLSAPDERTLVVRLVRPAPYFLELCAFATFMPVHARSVEPTVTLNSETGMLAQDASYWSDPKRVVGNGPYVLARREFKERLLLTQNPYYWAKDAMGNRSIEERIITDAQTAMIAYNDKLTDWLPDVPTAQPLAADLVASGREDVVTTPWVGTYFYNFNCLPMVEGKPNPLADPKVRRALSMGIDRGHIVDDVMRLRQPVATTFIPPGTLPGYSSPTTGVSYDPQAAKRLLAEAGYGEERPLAGLSILYNTNAGHENIAQEIKRSWEENLGVEVKLEGLETNTFKDRLKGHNFSIARASWIGDYRDPTTFLDKQISDNGNNDAGWSSPAYDALMKRAEDEPDPAKRLATLGEAEALMLREQPFAPIFHYVTLHVFDANRVQGLEPNVWNFRRLEKVRVVR